jgi:hypothetical protein
MVRFCIENKPHSAVYLMMFRLTAGKIYIFETRNLKSWLPRRMIPPDTYLYLCGGAYTAAAQFMASLSIVAKNNDYSGRASLIAYSPAVTTWYTLVIRAFFYWGKGTCDLYQTTDGGPPTRVVTSAPFGGYPIAAHWKSDERIEVANYTGSPRLLLINDDEDRMFFCNKYSYPTPPGPAIITPGSEDYGLVIATSPYRALEGRTDVCNYFQSYLDNPGKEKQVPSKVLVSEKMAKFLEKLDAEQESLSKIPIAEQEEKVQNLRDKMLSKEDIELLHPPEIEPPEGLKEANERYSKLLADIEPTLEALSMEERIEEMSILQERKRRLFKGIVPIHGRF